MLELKKVKTVVEYSHPEICVTNIITSSSILTGSDGILENPEKGDEWNWDL